MRRLVAIAALLLSPVLVACSEEVPEEPAAAAAADPAATSAAYAKTPVKRIFEQVATAMRKVRAVHVTARFEHDELGVVSAKLSVDRRGACAGTIRFPDVGSAQVRRVDTRPYFKPDYLYWERLRGDRADEIRARVGDKWIEGVDRQFARICELDELLAPFEKAPKQRGKVVRQGTRGSTPTVIVRTRAKGVSYYFEIAATAPHQLLRFSYGEWIQFVDLTKVNKPVKVTAPPPESLYEGSID